MQLSQDERPDPEGIGPLIMILPLLGLGIGFLLARARGPAEGGETPQAPTAQVAEESGWMVHRTLSDGSQLVAQLLPMHASASRETFDSRILQGRLGLAEGMPWQLWMERTGLPSGGVESTPEVECSLEDLWVEFERGVSLHPLLPPPITKPRVDPLANLLTRSPGRLSPGTAGRLLLWGPAPEGSGVLHGLGQPLPLAQDTVRRLPQTGGQLQPHARGDD